MIPNKRLLDYPDPIPTPEGLNFSHELITYFLRENEIKPGLYSGNEIKKILNKVYKSVQFELESEIGKFNKEIIYFIYKQIEYFTHQNISIRQQYEKSAKMSSNNKDIVNDRTKWSDNLRVPEDVIRHLFETTLKVCPEGENELTSGYFQDLEVLCAICVQIATISDYIFFKLADFYLKINEDYTVSWSNFKTLIDGKSHWKEFNKLRLDSDIIEYEQKPINNLNLDNGFEMDLGFKYTDFRDTLFSLSSLNTPKDEFYPLIYLEEDSLIKEIKNDFYSKNIDMPSSNVIMNILKFISIDPELFKESEVFLPNGLKMNMNRFVIRPLIKSKDKNKTFYLYGIESVLFTEEIYREMILQGRFPYKIVEGKECNEDIKNVCEEIRLIKKERETKLEKQLDEKLCEILGKQYVESNLKNFHRINKNLLRDPECGQIDSLAVDKENKIIHVLEAKYIKTGLVPQEVSNEIKKFFCSESEGGKDYLEKLTKKCNFVSSNIEIVLKHFKLIDFEGWQVKSTFVTNDVQISAFLTKTKIKFIRLSQLEDYLKK